MSQHLCVSGSSARSMSLDSCFSIHVYLRILCKIHAAGSIAQQPYVSQDPLQDPRLRIHVSASLFLTDSLQDPRLRIHVSASLHLRALCKIHVSGFMSQHLYISGSSARSMSPDPYISIFISQDPLQDPCLRIHISASRCISGSFARSMSSDSCLSIQQYGSSARSMSSDSCLSIFISQDPLQDPCLRIHVSASLYLRILCKIHLSDSCLRFMSQHPCVSLLCKISPIHVSASFYLSVLCKIHVSGFMSQQS